MRKAWLKSDPDFEKMLSECTRAIVDEVEALKNLVDEFAQFARLPAASLQPTSLHDVIEQALSLYDGLFPGIAIERRLAADLPHLRLDPDQMKRALINLVDNAIAATDEQGPHRRGHGVRPRRRRGPVSSWPTTARGSLPPTATSCSSRTSRPRSGAAGSASPS